MLVKVTMLPLILRQLLFLFLVATYNACDIKVLEEKKHNKKFPALNVLNDGDESEDTMWLSPYDAVMDESYFVLDLGCEQLFKGIRVRNTRNREANSRGTQKFSVYIRKTENGPWTKVLTEELQDARNVKDVPLEEFLFESKVIARHIKFVSESHYGNGGGIQYLELVKCLPLKKVSYPGEDIVRESTSNVTDTPEKCLDFCKSNPQCKFFTWQEEGCWIKSGVVRKTLQEDTENLVSGSKCIGGKFI